MNALSTPKIWNRAPRGGAISPVNERFYAGGRFMPRVPAPVLPTHALTFDVTRDDADVSITNPATGNTRFFRVITLTDGQLAGRRVAMIRDDAAREWTGFAFADAFGLHPWRRLATDQRVTGPSGYIALLTESARFAARGIQYQVTA